MDILQEGPVCATGESDSDASSAPRTEDEEGRQEGGGDGEEDEEEEEEEEEAPKKPQRGRKRRTEPVVIEREDGTKEEVSPQDWRRLRRRVTNRLSARRMRQKRAEERDAVAAEVGGPVPWLCHANGCAPRHPCHSLVEGST
jgi:hypothetical protein